MKLRISNTVCCLTLLIAMAPGMALAQKEKTAPCPPNTQVNLDLSGLASLAKLSALADLADLSSLADLAEVEKIPELMKLSDIAVELEDLHNEINIEQTGETIYINQDTEASFDAEKRKTFDKTYKVSSSDVLSIHNKFGNVEVNTWAKNEIKVKVDVISRAATDAKAQEILDNINIIDSRSGGSISVVTKMSPMRVSGNTNKSFEINYTIYMPEANALTVKNSFGDVNLASLKGKADISVSYGALKTERLNNSDNNVKVAYGSGNCGYINGGNVNLSYGDLYVGGANGLTGNASYGNFKVGQLTEEMDMTFKHGSFKVDNVSKDIKKIALNSNYGTVSLNFADNTAFNFDVNVQFGDFKVDKSLINITSLEKGYTSSEYKGRFGGTSPKGVVNINSKFGDVKFTK